MAFDANLTDHTAWVQRRCHDLVTNVEHFAERGDEVHLISFSTPDLPGAITHHPVPGPFDPLKDKAVYLRSVLKVRRLIRRIDPDLVHAHYLTSNGWLAAASGFHPLVLSARGTDVHGSMDSFFRRHLIRYAMDRADLVNPVSRDLERKILGLGVPASKVLCLTQGIDVERFVVGRAVRSDGPTRLICTRRLAPLYRCETIVEALTTLAAENVSFEFLFAATGPLEGSLRQRILDAGLGDSVRFRGGYSQAELPALLEQHDIFVSASSWDGTSPSLLEAMASGLFPVVSDIPANREWLTGDGDGLLFEAGRVSGLTECLRRAIADAALRARSIDLNRRRVRDRADRRVNMEILAACYERLVGGRPSGRRARR